MEMDYARFISFVRFCNENLTNETDYCIAKAITEHIGNLDEISINEIADMANTSAASVSRMIRKMEYPSLPKFRGQMNLSRSNFRNLLQMMFFEEFRNLDDEELSERLMERAVCNIRNTKESISAETKEELADLLLHAKSVSFFGDTREVRTFFTLQLALMTLNIPTYAFLNYETARLHGKSLGNGDLVFFFCLWSEWMTDEWKEMLRKVQDLGCTVVLFSQEFIPDLPEIRQIRYGIEGSANDGYYSLSYMNELFLMLVIKRGMDFHNL